MRAPALGFTARICNQAAKWAAMILVAGCFSDSTIQAEDNRMPDAERAMKSVGRQTWYDQQSDEYSPPTVSDAVDNPIRTQGWIAEKYNEKSIQRAKNAQAGRGGGNWNFGFSGIDPTLFSTLMIALLAVALITVILLLTYHSLRTYMPNRWEANNRKKAIEIDPAKVTELPFDVREAAHDNPLAEAEALMRAGDYSGAIIFLYGYMLLALDQSRAIELQRGKTNRMYLRELNRQSELRAVVEAAMLSFEEVYFGQHTLSYEQFMASWNQLDRFHDLATGSLAAAGQPLRAEVVPT